MSNLTFKNSTSNFLSMIKLVVSINRFLARSYTENDSGTNFRTYYALNIEKYDERVVKFFGAS